MIGALADCLWLGHGARTFSVGIVVLNIDVDPACNFQRVISSVQELVRDVDQDSISFESTR